MTDILFLSLLQDISSLEALILRICDGRRNNTHIINSWRMPTKNFLDTIHFNVDETQPTSLQYTTILEVVIDRLYILLNQYLDHTANTTGKCSLQHIPGTPLKISLGALNNNVWEGIESVCELNKIYGRRSLVEIVSKKDARGVKGIVNSETQTEEIYSSQCNSCFVAVNCIKRCARQLELLLPDSFTEKNRKHLEPNIFEMTQFGCMNSIITAILADVQVLTETIRKTQNDYQEEAARNSILQNKFDNNLKSTAELEVELNKSEKKNEKLLIEIENYKSELCSKCESENTCKDLVNTFSQKLQTAKDKVNTLQNELGTIHCNDTILKREITNLQQQKEQIIVERDMWKLNCSSSNENNNTLTLQNEDLKSELVALTDNVQRTEESLRSMNLLIEINATKVDERMHNLNVLLNKLQGTVGKKMVAQQEQMFKLKESLSQTSTATNIVDDDQSKNKKQENNLAIMKGDPIEDMTKQIEVNNTNMKKLKAQNETLIHTINKLQRIQVKKRLSIY